MNKKCIVIGGGAAGMMAAITAADTGIDVELLEKNEKLGKKIYITGKGRCNVTNDCEPDVFFANVVSNPKFLYSAFYTFSPTQIMELLQEKINSYSDMLYRIAFLQLRNNQDAEDVVQETFYQYIKNF